MAAPGQPSQSLIPPSVTASTLSSFKEKFPQLNVSLVSSSSTSPVQLQPVVVEGPPTTSPPECQTANIATLSEMFPLMTEAALLSALLQCGGRLSSALDLLLTQDLVDSERHQQSLYTRFRPICDLWVRGQCSGARAAACRDRHFYNDADASRRTFTSSGKKESRKLKGFSSPYREKVVREQVEVVKERVNLDSGNYEKWSEVQERELVDLTGNNAGEIIDLSSDDDDKSCDKFKQSNAEVDMERIKRETNNLEDDLPVEGKGDMRMVPGVEKQAKRKLEFGSESENENEKSEVLIKSLIVQMESFKHIIDQTAVAIVNTGDLSLKRKGRDQNKKSDGKPKKRVKVELPKTNADHVVNHQESKKEKKKTKRNKGGTKSIIIVQQTSKTDAGELIISKKSKAKKKSKKKKAGMKSSKIEKKPNVPVKSEKSDKISKSNVVVKSENKPFSSQRKQGGNTKRLEGKLKAKQEKV